VTEIAVAIETPREAEIMRLIEELDAYQAALYPAESNHLLDVDALAAPDMRFAVARRAGDALGCGALRIDPSGYGELKRMFVLPRARGQRIGRRILEFLEAEARQAGLSWMRLETGIHQPEAIALYRAAGYCERAPFGQYQSDPLSLFMERAL
jgi:putative acetyltransferase